MRQLRRRPYILSRKVNREIHKFFCNKDMSLETFKNKKCIDNIIVSFTSFPARIKYVEYTVFSLMQQTIRPGKIVLWLSEQEFPDKENEIPKSLEKYFEFNFEIHFVKTNYRSFMKLVYSLDKYPDYSIITIDDDCYYKNNWLELLYNTHASYPKDILATRVHPISFTGKNLDPYDSWCGNGREASRTNFLVGCGGVFYPPNSLYKDAGNPDLFLKLCPTYTDDVWFYINAFLNKTNIRRIDAEDIVLPVDYKLTRNYRQVPKLGDINIDKDGNNIQMKNVLSYYNLYEELYAEYLLTK